MVLKTETTKQRQIRKVLSLITVDNNNNNNILLPCAHSQQNQKKDFFPGIFFTIKVPAISLYEQAIQNSSQIQQFHI